MLDFRGFNDDMYIYKSQLDEWGVSTVASEGIPVKGTIREQIDLLTLQGQKGKSTVVTYTVGLSNTIDIKSTDLIGIPVDGTIKKFEILKMRVSRDLSSEPTFKKVWI